MRTEAEGKKGTAPCFWRKLTVKVEQKFELFLFLIVRFLS